MMKGIAIVLTCIILSVAAKTQSPYLSVHVKMDSAKTANVRYKIQMKICQPKKMAGHGNWFSHDTSAIDFAALKQEDINCGNYFSSGEGIEVLSGDKVFEEYNSFEYGNQIFAWENILVFKISNWSSRGWWPEMYVVLPVKYKSFTTFVDLSEIEFQSGKVIFLTELNATYKESKLYFTQSLEKEKAVEVNNFPLKEVLEKE